MAIQGNTTSLPRRHLLAGIFGAATVAALPAIEPAPKRSVTKWGSCGPLLADDVTGTTDYADWAQSSDNPFYGRA